LQAPLAPELLPLLLPESLPLLLPELLPEPLPPLLPELLPLLPPESLPESLPPLELPWPPLELLHADPRAAAPAKATTKLAPSHRPCIVFSQTTGERLSEAILVQRDMPHARTGALPWRMTTYPTMAPTSAPGSMIFQ